MKESKKSFIQNHHLWNMPTFLLFPKHHYKESVQDVRQRRSDGYVQTMQLHQTSQAAAGASPPLVPPSSNNDNTGDIAALIVQQQRMNSLPTRDLTVFNGEPLNFRSFNFLSTTLKATQAVIKIGFMTLNSSPLASQRSWSVAFI